MFYLTLTQSTKKVLLLVLSALFAYWLLFAPGISQASEMYTLTEPELVRLETSLNRLQQINEQSQTELTQLRAELAKAKEELRLANTQLTEQTKMLQALKTTSIQQEKLLQTANESLRQFAAEEKRTRLQIKAQRNLWQGISLAMAIVAATK